MTETPQHPPAADPCERPSKARRFWRVLPWVLLALIVSVLCVRWVVYRLAMRSAAQVMNARFEGGKGPFQVKDLWKGGEDFNVARYVSNLLPDKQDETLIITTSEGYNIHVEVDPQTHKLRCVSVGRDAECFIMVSRNTSTDAAFPTSFSLEPQQGPDKGCTLMDTDGDGKFDYKMGPWGDPDTKYYHWEDGKGWVENTYETEPELKEPGK